jgi:hypothetical protein
MEQCGNCPMLADVTREGCVIFQDFCIGYKKRVGRVRDCLFAEIPELTNRSRSVRESLFSKLPEEDKTFLLAKADTGV